MIDEFECGRRMTGGPPANLTALAQRLANMTLPSRRPTEKGLPYNISNPLATSVALRQGANLDCQGVTECQELLDSTG